MCYIKINMNLILVIDRDVESFERETAEWLKYNFEALRLDSMQDAIVCLMRGESEFLFISVNENSIPGFMRQLPILRSVTSIPIFVFTSSYSTQKKIEALNSGADVYESFQIDTTQNVPVTYALLNVLSRRAAKAEPPPLLINGELLVVPLRRAVFVSGTELNITKKEFEVLLYLMSNVGSTVTHRQLLQKIWGEEYGENDVGVLWRTVDRLRGKLSALSTAHEYIRAERGVGYIFERRRVERRQQLEFEGNLK